METESRDRDKSLYAEASKAEGWNYRGQLSTKPSLKLDFDDMEQDALVAYAMAFTEITNQLRGFCDGFPHKRAKDTSAWGLPIPVVERAVAVYVDGEQRTLDGLPARSTKAQRDDWCLMAFGIAVDIATKEALRGDINLPKGPKTTPGGPLSQGKGLSGRVNRRP